jgi:ABC-type lipoprotein release transport system permease subunit
MNLRLFHRIAALFRRDTLDADLEAEMAFHIDQAIADNLESGMSQQEARRQALMQFGGTQQTKESVRDHRSLPFLETFFHDLAFGFRMLRKSPAFASVSVLTLALGIGATTAIFSVVYGVLLRPLPYHNPHQIVRLWEQSENGNRMNFADPNFDDLRAQNHSLSGLAVFQSSVTTITGKGDASRISSSAVSRDFFQVMAIQPVFGRTFFSEEQRPNAPAVALVSYAYWTQALGSTQDLSSVRLKMDNKPLSLIGVLPPGFRFPDNSDIWFPYEIFDETPSRTAHNDRLIGRLRDGFTVAEARTELSTIAQRLKQQYGPDTNMVSVAIEPLHHAMTNDVRPALILLLVASAFLLLIACANVTNLMLAQAAARERELAIRAALGAPRLRLLRQFLTEAFLLSFIGGVLGVLFAYWGLNGLLALAPATLPRVDEVSINLPVLLFSLLAVSLVSVALAIFTAIRSTSCDSRAALSEGSRGGIGTPNKQRIGRLLAAAQLATALILLVGAALLGRSLLRVLSINSGFRTENVVTMDLGFPSDGSKPDRIAFLNQLFARLHQIPGVDEVGGTNNLPLSNAGFPDGSFVVMNPSQISPRMQNLIQRSLAGNLEKDPALLAEFTNFFDELFRDKSHLGEADFLVTSAGFFKALSIPLLQGRLFEQHDTIDAPHVALISQSLAKQTWPNQDPIGRTIEFGNMDGDPRLLTIVGVVGDVRDHSLESAPPPTVYVDYRQRPVAAYSFTVVLHTSANPDSVTAAARSILHELDPNMPPRFNTLSQVYSASLDARRFSFTLIIIFSLTALLLAIAGIYGVISYSVAQRTREIGVRMALGATTREVLLMVLKQGAVTGTIGIAAGLLGSFAITRLLQSQLFEISPTDPLTLLGASAMLLLVSLAACTIPGRRATRIDPVVALRCE